MRILFTAMSWHRGSFPQISAVLGACAGGAVYSPAMTDFYHHGQGFELYVRHRAGCDQGVTHEEVTKEDLGGAMTHNAKSGVAHLMAENDEQALMMIRELMSYLPSTIWKILRRSHAPMIFTGKTNAFRPSVPD